VTPMPFRRPFIHRLSQPSHALKPFLFLNCSFGLLFTEPKIEIH
jgi:hypothetical protein